MSKNITAADLNMALDTMSSMKQKWEKEHPNQKMPECPYCHNVGLIKRTYDEWDNEVFGKDRFKPDTYDYYEPCKCIKKSVNQIYKNNRKFANVPGLYADACFDNFKTEIYSKVESRQLATIAKQEAMKYVLDFEEYQEKGMGLYIYSDARGSGKSRLASTISNELINLGFRNKFASASGILSEIQKTWNDNNSSEAKILENYIEPNVLIIDDFGARHGKDWIDIRFQDLINYRYQGKKVTIFTSNYEVNQLPFNDNRIMDRLSEIEMYHKIKMPNETVRFKNKNGSNADPFYEIGKKRG